jgi:hypothetical protein
VARGLEVSGLFKRQDVTFNKELWKEYKSIDLYMFWAIHTIRMNSYELVRTRMNPYELAWTRTNSLGFVRTRMDSYESAWTRMNP